jgi:hypothetical protein
MIKTARLFLLCEAAAGSISEHVLRGELDAALAILAR